MRDIQIWVTSFGLFCFVVPAMPAAMPMSEINAMEFFNEQLKDDGIHFTWAHAVNEYFKLKTCLKGNSLYAENKKSYVQPNIRLPLICCNVYRQEFQPINEQ